MKILMVCQRYYPEALQNVDICEQLVQDGHNVTIVTGLPNYEKGYVLKNGVIYRNEAVTNKEDLVMLDNR